MNKTAASTVQRRLMDSLLPFLFLGLTATSLLAKAPSSVPTVMVLGDSLSVGYGLKRADAFPALLSKKAAASGKRIHIVNAGVSGDTTAGGLRRLSRLLDHRVDVLVIELGINDAFRGVPVPEIRANLQQIFGQTRALYPEARIVIAGMQLPGYAGDDYLAAFGAMYTELAQRNHAELVPFLLDGVAGNPQLNLPDLIHPNASGQKILAANVWPALESALRKTRRS